MISNKGEQLTSPSAGTLAITHPDEAVQHVPQPAVRGRADSRHGVIGLSPVETVRERITRQLQVVATIIRASHESDPDAFDDREHLWMLHFNLLADLEALVDDHSPHERVA